MKQVFKPEDFDTQIGDNRMNDQIANDRLQELIDKSPVVYFSYINNNMAAIDTKKVIDVDTHKGCVMFIEDLKTEQPKPDIYTESGVMYNGEMLYKKVKA